jgi:hypothetical protein
MSCTYQKYANHEDDRIRHFKQEIEVARVKIRKIAAEK